MVRLDFLLSVYLGDRCTVEVGGQATGHVKVRGDVIPAFTHGDVQALGRALILVHPALRKRSGYLLRVDSVFYGVGWAED